MSVSCGKLVQIWFMLSYAVFIAIIKCLQIVLRFTIEPFSKRICRNLEKYLLLPVFQYLVFLMDWWSEIRFILYTDGEAKDKFFGKENAMCFMNTQNNLLQKLVMAKLSDNFDFVQISDNNVFQWNDGNDSWQSNSSTYRQIGGNQYWCVLFPEQTQCHCDNLNQLGPTLSNFQNVLSKRNSSEPKDNLAAIYDISIIIPGNKTDIISRDIFAKESINAHVYLKRIPLDEMPDEESHRKIFLEELIEEKNFTTHQFLDSGEFLERQTGINIIEQYEFEPTVRSAVSFVVSSTFTLLVFASVIVIFAIIIISSKDISMISLSKNFFKLVL